MSELSQVDHACGRPDDWQVFVRLLPTATCSVVFPTKPAPAEALELLRELHFTSPSSREMATVPMW
jgi:hypothetical protein